MRTANTKLTKSHPLGGFRGLLYLLFIASSLNAQLKVAGIFGNNAVIQQGIASPVWGTASPNATVSVLFANTEFKTTANDQGSWMIRTNPLKADGKSYELKVSSENSTIIYKNILIGEVWFASGQSNMGFIVNDLANMEAELRNADFPEIRCNMIDRITSAQPLADIKQHDWQIASVATVKNFSAVAYLFAKELHLDRKVPVGIIVAARGATNLETWISRERLLTHPDFTEKLAQFDNDTTRWNAKVNSAIQAEKDREIIANTSMIGLNQKVHTLNFDDSGWGKTDFPLNMGKMNYAGFWGLVWIRKVIDIPTNATNKNWKLYLPIKDQNDRIYLNGKEIANGVSKLKDKVIAIPAGSIKKGENLLAIRMYVHWGSAEIGNDVSECYLKAEDNQRIDLKGSWSHSNKIEPAVAQWQDFYNTNNVNYNAMISPVIPYGIKGFLWYQGENNASRFKQYAALQSMLIDDWRVRWGLGYLPFLYVQLANYRERSEMPKETDDWASLRDAQTELLKKSQNTGMTCTIDIGDANDIHPKNKYDVAKRLYLNAKVLAYNDKNVVCSGPIFNAAKVEGNVIKITFDYAQNGLKTKENQPVKGFALCDTNGKWTWADAKIAGNEIMIENAKNSTRIQYAWQTNPECNLLNTEGLPAVPFNVEIHH